MTMYTLKSPEEIASMQKGGSILKKVLDEAILYTRIGISTNELNNFIEDRIYSYGAEPGFKRVKGYNWGTCICINEQIVHTPPSDRIIQDGDVVTIDAGVYHEGLHTDSAVTVQVGKKDQDVTKFLETGTLALRKAVKEAIVGKRIGHISQVFEKTIESEGYSIVHELTGHGVGYELHEDPYIPCFLDKKISDTLLLKPGMTLALEVMYAMGQPKIVSELGGWSLKMKDNSIAATFECSVALTEKRTLILT